MLLLADMLFYSRGPFLTILKLFTCQTVMGNPLLMIRNFYSVLYLFRKSNDQDISNNVLRALKLYFSKDEIFYGPAS